MKDVLNILLCSIVIVVAVSYAWHKLLDKKINFKDYKLYISLMGILFTSLLNYFITNAFIRIAIVTLILIIFFKFLFRENLNTTIITPIFVQILIFFCEFLYTITLLSLFSKNSDEMINSVLFNFSTNVVVATLLVITINIKFVRQLYIKLLNATDKIKGIQLSLFCIIGMLILNILLTSSFYKMKIQYFLTFNVIITVLVLIIIFYSFKTQNKYNKVSNKYNIAIKSLKDLESMMTKYRILNHENKNLLLTVRAMIVNKDKDIPKYIDSIIKEKYSDDEKLLFDVSSIPSGGLRATIYSEILKIKENGITYLLNIDRKISALDLIDVDTDTIISICKIIGVFIDNSIEAVYNLTEKNINIELYTEKNKLCIKVSNNYKGDIDIGKINDPGYTTKGKGHGYGLSLVKNIIKNNPIFDNVTEISKDVFSQILIIKYKKENK